MFCLQEKLKIFLTSFITKARAACFLVCFTNMMHNLANSVPIKLLNTLDCIVSSINDRALFVCGGQTESDGKRLMHFVEKIDLHYTKLRRSTLLQQARTFILSGGNDSKEVY